MLCLSAHISNCMHLWVAEYAGKAPVQGKKVARGKAMAPGAQQQRRKQPRGRTMNPARLLEATGGAYDTPLHETWLHQNQQSICFTCNGLDASYCLSRRISHVVLLETLLALLRNYTKSLLITESTNR